MQFQVPQFIETEDKIVGPFTLKQFIFVAAAVGLSLMLYFLVVPWLWLILSLPIVGIGIGFAFIKIEGRSLPAVAAAALRYLWKPQTYVWQPKEAMGDKGQRTKDKGQRPATAGITLEEVLSGVALRRTWQKLQTGGKVSPGTFLAQRDHYSIYRKRTGERAAARRIDYR
jgi:hypothetical protein